MFRYNNGSDKTLKFLNVTDSLSIGSSIISNLSNSNTSSFNIKELFIPNTTELVIDSNAFSGVNITNLYIPKDRTYDTSTFGANSVSNHLLYINSNDTNNNKLSYITDGTTSGEEVDSEQTGVINYQGSLISIRSASTILVIPSQIARIDKHSGLSAHTDAKYVGNYDTHGKLFEEIQFVPGRSSECYIRFSAFYNHEKLKEVYFGITNEIASWQNNKIIFHNADGNSGGMNSDNGGGSGGTAAFQDCTSLTYVNLNGLNSDIARYTFADCNNLTKVHVPSNFPHTNIWRNAFSGCSSLTTIDLSQFTHIYESAFQGCTNLESVDLNNIEYIGNSAFNNCNSITTLEFNAPNIEFGSQVFNKSVSSSLYNINTLSFRNEMTSLIIGNSFGYIDLQELIIPPITNGTDNISQTAFSGIITNLYIDVNGPFEIPTSTFKGATVTNVYTYNILDNVNIQVTPEPQSKATLLGRNIITRANIITTTEGSVIRNVENPTITKSGITTSISINITDISSITIELATIIGTSAFSGASNLNSVIIDSSMTDINEKAFFGCNSLNSINFPSTLTTIGKEVFQNCNSLNTIDLSNTSITTLSTRTLFNNSLNFILPRNIETIGNRSIYNSTLKNLILPPGFDWSDSNNFKTDAFFNSTITNLFYDASFGTITSSKFGNVGSSTGSITNLIPYDISNGEAILSGRVYNTISSIFEYPARNNLTINMDSTTNKNYQINLNNLSSDTNFRFIRTNPSNDLLKFSITGSGTVTNINSILNSSTSTSLSNIIDKILISDVLSTLSNSDATLNVSCFSIDYFRNQIGSSNFNNFEVYNIDGGLTFVGDINSQNVLFIDSNISSINFGSKVVSGVRFSGSFNIPSVTNANNSTLESLYYKYSIVDGYLYDKLYIEARDVSYNRDYSTEFGSSHKVRVDKKAYFINGRQTPMLHLLNNRSYDVSINASAFTGSVGLFKGFPNNLPNYKYPFGGTNTSDIIDNSMSITMDSASNTSENNWYYGNTEIEGIGGLANNITLYSQEVNIPVPWIGNTITQDSSLKVLTVYEYIYPQTTTHFSKNQNVTGLLEQQINTIDNSGMYVNGKIHPVCVLKPDELYIIEVLNASLNGSTQSISAVNNKYDVFKNITGTSFHSGEFTNRYDNSNWPYYLGLKLNPTNAPYAYEDVVSNIRFGSYKNIDISSGLTSDFSFVDYDYDICLNSPLTNDVVERIESETIMEYSIISKNTVNNNKIVVGNFGTSYTLDANYCTNEIVSFLNHFSKMQFGNTISALTTPTFNLTPEIAVLLLRNTDPFMAYLGSLEIDYHGIQNTSVIRKRISQMSRIDIIRYVEKIRDNLRTSVSSGYRYPYFNQISNLLANNFTSSQAVHEMEEIQDIFTAYSGNKHLSKLNDTTGRFVRNSLGRSSVVPSTSHILLNNDYSIIDQQYNIFNTISTIKPKLIDTMPYHYSLAGPAKFEISGGVYTGEKAYIINHRIQKCINTSTNTDISFTEFLNKFRHVDHSGNVDISTNYYIEMKHVRREFDVEISNNTYLITYTPNSIYNTDITASGEDYNNITYTGNALDSNGNLNLRENEVYLFHQTHASNLDNGILEHALTIYPVDKVTNQPLKYALLHDAIPNTGNVFNTSRSFYCCKPKDHTLYISDTSYYFGSIREAVDISFGEWYYDTLYDFSENRFDIIVDVSGIGDSEFIFLKDYIHDVDKSNTNLFQISDGSSISRRDISSIILHDGTSISQSDISTFSFLPSLPNTLGTYIKKSEWYSVTHSNGYITVLVEDMSYIIMNNSTSIAISDITHIFLSSLVYSLHTFNPLQLPIINNKSYRFRRTTRVGSVVSTFDISDNGSFFSILSNSIDEHIEDISNNTDINFKNPDGTINRFGSSYDPSGDYYAIQTSMGGYINILPSIPIGDGNGLSNVGSEYFHSRNIPRSGSYIERNNQQLYIRNNSHQESIVLQIDG